MCYMFYSTFILLFTKHQWISYKLYLKRDIYRQPRIQAIILLGIIHYLIITGLRVNVLNDDW